MEKYFELRESGKILYGIVSNIPDETEEINIKERLEVPVNKKDYADSSLLLIDEIITNPDIIMDWNTLDYVEGLDKDFIDVSDSLYLAINKGLESEVVYTALKEMKKNPNLTISETILNSLNNWIK